MGGGTDAHRRAAGRRDGTAGRPRRPGATPSVAHPTLELVVTVGQERGLVATEIEHMIVALAVLLTELGQVGGGAGRQAADAVG